MRELHKYEDMIEGWLKPVPHLPKEWTKWLADNAWWLTFLGVVVSVIAGLVLLSLLIVTFPVLSFLSFISTTTVTYSGLGLIAALVSLVFLVLTVGIEAKAINPLKAMSRKGWDLLFMAYLVGLVSMTASLVLNLGYYNFLSTLFGDLISAFVGAYVLFEVRDHFKIEAKRVKK